MHHWNSVISWLIIAGAAVYFIACYASVIGNRPKKRKEADGIPAVSVIIPARNEERNIGLLLDDLISQDYARDRLEIVVVDDSSEDGTGAVVRECMRRDDRIIFVEKHHSASEYRYKKRAVLEGILASHGDIIMTVDADCRVPHTWVRSMCGHFTTGVELVAGEVVINGDGMIAGLETLEFAGIQAMAAGFMNLGFPLTCNGANLAYRREAFLRVRGFESIRRIISGDDDLLMQKIAASDSSRVVFTAEREVAVTTAASGSAGEFLAKRARWASKIVYYPSRSALAMLAGFFLFFVGLLAGPVLCIAGLLNTAAYGAALLLKISGDIPLAVIGAGRMGRPGLLALLPVAEMLHIPYIIFVTVKGVFGSFSWRGRTVRATHPEEA